MMQLKRSTLFICTGMLIVCAIVAGSAVTILARSGAVQAATPAAVGAVSAPIPYGYAPDYRAIVAQNRDAVVGVTAEISAPEDESESEPQSDSPELTPFGGNDPPDGFFRGIPAPRRKTSTLSIGSGFIVRPDGIILTNAHVVRGAQRITVKFADRRELRAKMLGLDNPTDLAVLKVDAHNLPTVRLAEGDNVAVGDYVLAIGQPFALEQSATAGIVSAKGRSLEDNSPVQFLQTDVPVNFGNSGGPLFNARGEVIGINSQIYSNTGGYLGISFAIPIQVAERVEQQILTTGKVAHARLGVQVQAVDQSLASSFKLSSPEGAVVSLVEPDSAAAAAGLEIGDVILKLNGNPLSDNNALKSEVDSTPPGETVTLGVWRGGKPLTLRAKLQSASASEGRTASPDESEPAHIGLSVRPLTPEERSQIGVASGLVVQGSSGPAAAAGIQPGDVLLTINGTPLMSTEQLQRGTQDSNMVALLIQRGDQRIFVPVQLR